MKWILIGDPPPPPHPHLLYVKIKAVAVTCSWLLKLPETAKLWDEPVRLKSKCKILDRCIGIGIQVPGYLPTYQYLLGVLTPNPDADTYKRASILIDILDPHRLKISDSHSINAD